MLWRILTREPGHWFLSYFILLVPAQIDLTFSDLINTGAMYVVYYVHFEILG